MSETLTFVFATLALSLLGVIFMLRTLWYFEDKMKGDDK